MPLPDARWRACGSVAHPRSGSGVRERVRRFDCPAATRDTTGPIEAMSLWAGQSVGAVTRAQPATEIRRELLAEAKCS